VCQWYMAKALSPVRQQFPDAIIYHYMDDILIPAPDLGLLETITKVAIKHLKDHGLVIAPEKIQQTFPWKYLGWKILDRTIQPQAVKVITEIRTLNDVQKTLGAINWVRSLLGITNEDLKPLFQLLKGDTNLNSPWELTVEGREALHKIAQALESWQACHINEQLPLNLYV
ncbi:hypothetical protein N331_10048, partial [Merops nubicus]